MTEILEHYGAHRLTRVVSVEQAPPDHWELKPRGLWLSVKGEHGWPQWVRDNCVSFPLTWRHRIRLSPDANILRLRTEDEVIAFANKYRREIDWPETDRNMRFGPGVDWPVYESRFRGADWGIEWSRVAAEFDGIIVARYHRRLTFLHDVGLWHYAWDCASGAIWNARAIGHISAMRLAGERRPRYRRAKRAPRIRARTRSKRRSVR